jgi:hypothetical protein
LGKLRIGCWGLEVGDCGWGLEVGDSGLGIRGWGFGFGDWGRKLKIKEILFLINFA